MGFLAQTAEVLASWENPITRDSVGDALGGHEARCCGASGVNPQEGEDCHCAVRADELDEVVDYDVVRTMVQQRIARGHINLQETLVDDLVAGLLAHPKVVAVRVASAKPDVYRDVEAVGIEVLRFSAAPTQPQPHPQPR